MADEGVSGLAVQSQRIERIIEELASPERLDVDGIPRWNDSPLIGIVGSRGSGKTTLLHHLCQSLDSSERYLILPVIRPEMLSTSESVLVTMLGAALNLTEQVSRGASDDCGPGDVARLAQRALRSALFSSTSSLAQRFDGSVSLGQFTVDSASIIQRVTTLKDDVDQFVRALLQATRRRGIIVPIDDIDLVPGRMTRLLFDVRFLSQCGGIQPIICLSWGDLKANLRAETSQLFPALDASGLDRLVDQQVMKTLRPDRAFEPLQLPRNEKLEFTPFGYQKSLRELLVATLNELDGDSEPLGLGSWLDVESRTEASNPLAIDWLPDTYRGLEHLYFVAAGLGDALAHDSTGIEIGHHLRNLASTISRDTSGLSIDIEIQSVAARSSTGMPARVSLQAEWPPWQLVIAAEPRWHRVVNDSGSLVSLREVHRPVVREPSQEKVTGSSSWSPSSTSVEVSRALLVQSLLSTAVLDDPRPAGPLFLGDRECEHLQLVRVYGLPTDDTLLLLPPSASIVAADRWLKAWNWLVRSSSGAVATLPAASLVANLIQAVTQIYYLGRDPAVEVAHGELLPAMDVAASMYVRLANDVKPDDDWRVSASKAFCEWFERMLPFAFHEALIADDDLTSILANWQAALSMADWGNGAKKQLADIFERRLRRSSDMPSAYKERIWLFGYRALMRNINAEIALLLNDFEKEYMERKGRGSRGKEAVDQAATLTFHQGSYRFAAHPTEEGRVQEMTIRRLLSQLRDV